MQMDAFIHLAPEYNALRPILKLSVVIPAAVLCFLPLKGKLKRSAHTLVSLGLPFLVLWTVAGGLICNALSWKSNTWLAPSLVAFAVFYCWISDLSVWKTISVFLAVCAVFSCLTNLATTADALLAPENHSPWFTLPGVAIHILLCWAVLACVWYPATHAAHGSCPNGRCQLPGMYSGFCRLFLSASIFLSSRWTTTRSTPAV